MKKNHGESAYSRAYAAWFSRYEAERRRQHRRRGATIPDFPDPPASPEEIARAVDTIGARRVLALLEIHRATLARWLSGASVIPRPAWLVLALLADGRLPGMSDEWRGWRFDGDTLHQIGTRNSYTARELSGIPYQLAHARALARRVAALEKEKAHLLKVGYFEAANDPIASHA